MEQKKRFELLDAYNKVSQIKTQRTKLRADDCPLPYPGCEQCSANYLQLHHMHLYNQKIDNAQPFF